MIELTYLYSKCCIKISHNDYNLITVFGDIEVVNQRIYKSPNGNEICVEYVRIILNGCVKLVNFKASLLIFKRKLNTQILPTQFYIAFVGIDRQYFIREGLN